VKLIVNFEKVKHLGSNPPKLASIDQSRSPYWSVVNQQILIF